MKTFSSPSKASTNRANAAIQRAQNPLKTLVDNRLTTATQRKLQEAAANRVIQPKKGIPLNAPVQRTPTDDFYNDPANLSIPKRAGFAVIGRDKDWDSPLNDYLNAEKSVRPDLPRTLSRSLKHKGIGFDKDVNKAWIQKMIDKRMNVIVAHPNMVDQLNQGEEQQKLMKTNGLKPKANGTLMEIAMLLNENYTWNGNTNTLMAP